MYDVCIYIYTEVLPVRPEPVDQHQVVDIQQHLEEVQAAVDQGQELRSGSRLSEGRRSGGDGTRW